MRGRRASACSVATARPHETSARSWTRTRLALLAARLDAALAQRPAELELLLGRALLVGARRLEDHRQAVEARLAEEHRAAVLAQLALADVGVAVAVGAQLALRVVEVQRAEGVEADERRTLVEHACQPVGGPDVEAAGVQVAGVQAHAEPLVAAGGVDQAGQLVEGPAQRSAGARGVLQVQRAALALGQ